MRKGKNLSKDVLLSVLDSYHRIIIPLYIPLEEGYYKDAFEIFNYCLKSIHKTSFTNIVVSVVSNGSCHAVNSKLFQLQEEGLINELIIETENIGKINSILKALRTTEERFVTITDGDILFLNNWEQNVFEVFESFPKAAAVSPMPVFRTQNTYTSNILFDYLFSKKIRFSPVKNQEAMTMFAKSIGWPWLDSIWKDVILTIENKNGNKVVLGCNHSVVTYKNELFGSLPKQNSKFILGGKSEEKYLDKLSQYYDGYRLATYDNFAYHLGNVKEDWMTETFNSLKEEKKLQYLVKYKKLKKRKVNYFIKNVFFKKVMNFPVFKKKFYLCKGLDASKLKNFM